MAGGQVYQRTCDWPCLWSQWTVWPVSVRPVAPAGVQNEPAWTPVWTPFADTPFAAAEAEALTPLAEALALAALLATPDAFDLIEAAAEAAWVTDDAAFFADEQPATMTNATAATAIQPLTRTNLKNCPLNYYESVTNHSW